MLSQPRHARFGYRGVITKAELTSDDQSELPCIAIPDSLAITPQLAGSKLNELLSAVGLTGSGDLSMELLVALYLAHERSKGVHLSIMVRVLAYILLGIHACL